MPQCPACSNQITTQSTACPFCGYLPGQSRPNVPRAPAVPRPPVSQPALVSSTSSTQPSTKAAPVADARDSQVIAGKFAVIELLGEGGMGKVYKAKHLALDKIVCVKMLRQSLIDDKTVVGRFEREAKAASRLNHPNSIQVLDFGQDTSGELYLVMEYVSGKDLRKTLIEEFPLGEERICQIVAQVLSALSAAHSQNVIHRDLKPENIMLEQRRGEADFVKVLDFGIAKITEADVPGLTRADVVCGTPLYMSPEQATGSPIDHRADLYAIGVMLYQLTTGFLPFEGSNSMEILTKHVTDLPIPPRARRPEVAISPEMESLILRAMSKEPEDRPQSAELFRTELNAIADILRRKRESIQDEAKRANTAHKQERQTAIREKQQAQLAAYSSTNGSIAAAIPAKNNLPLIIGATLGGIVLTSIIAYFLTRSPTPIAPPIDPPVVVSKPVDPPKDPVVAPVDPPKDPVVTKPVDPPKDPVANIKPQENPAHPIERRPDVVIEKTGEKPVPEVSAKKALAMIEEADLALEEGDAQKSATVYKQAMQLDPTSSTACRGLARSGAVLRNLAMTREGAECFVRLVPNGAESERMRILLKK